jgi:hypothetical protein
MMRQRFLWIAVAGLAILLFGRGLRADTVRVGVGAHGAGFGFWIGSGPVYHPPMYRGSWHHRYVRIMPPHPGVVIVPPPVVIDPRPPVIVQSPAPVIQPSTVEVWITNSNGSKNSVRLTREGPWYVGPRGEYYADMPTNEQLRIVYGF